MSLYKKFKNDADKERNGVWVEYDGAVQLLMRRAGGLNEYYQKILRQKTEPHERKLRTNSLPPETVERILREAYAESIVSDWRTKTGKDDAGNDVFVPTIEDAEGKQISFTSGACAKLFEDLPDFFTMVREDATTRALFHSEAREDDAKN